MKKNYSKSIICLYVAAVILTLFIAALIDKTGDTGYAVALPLCVLGLVVIIFAYYKQNEKKTNLAESIDENSYAVLNKDVYAIEVNKEDKDNVVVKLTRKN